MQAYWGLVRPFTLLPPMLGMLTGALAAIGATGNSLEDSLGLILIGMLMSAVLNGASNVLNQIFDLEQDRINKPNRPLVTASISVRAAGIFA